GGRSARPSPPPAMTASALPRGSSRKPAAQPSQFSDEAETISTGAADHLVAAVSAINLIVAIASKYEVATCQAIYDIVPRKAVYRFSRGGAIQWVVIASSSVNISH